MQYRKLPHGVEQISVIGMGMGSIHQDNSEEEMEQIVRLAMDNGINYFDMAAPDMKPYISYARAFEGRREQVYMQMHFGAVYDNGKYGWTRDLKRIKDAFAEQLHVMHTDYTDMGYVHCVDEIDDFHKIMSDGVWDYMKGLKRDGVIRHLGVSSHTPEIVRRFLDTGLVDMIMFSINPAYDYSVGKYGIGTAADRGLLYRECEREGVGIAVMKAFSGGQLLDAGTSPFRKALTENQCIQYALDRPGVLTVLPGYRNRADLQKILAYFEAKKQDVDYSVLGQMELLDADGICVYCNHCQPCPRGLDIGLINKYYDLALAGDEMAGNHYGKLSVKADACVQCGHCELRCPFHVKQEARMKEIAQYFYKKATILMLSAFLTLSMAACGNTDTLSGSFSDPTTSGEESPAESGDSATEEPTETGNNFISEQYEVGDIILADGSIVKGADITAIDNSNVPVAVIAGLKEDGTAFGVGVHRSDSPLQWASDNSAGYAANFSDTICTQKSDFEFSGDKDGMDNWEAICVQDSEDTVDAAANYPAFHFVNTYAKTYNLSGDMVSGWYMPSIVELCGIYQNRETINLSLQKIYGFDEQAAMNGLGTNWYWSSSQAGAEDDYAWFVHFFNGYAGECPKNFTNVHALAVREFRR